MKIHKNAACRLFAALAVCCMAFCACNTDIPIIDGGSDGSEDDQKTCDADGDVRCFASNSNQLATLKTCKDGHWTLTETCSSPRCSSDLSACAPCADGETVCSEGSDGSGTAYACNDGELVFQKSCAGPCKSDGTCGDCFNDDPAFCENATLRTCVNFSYVWTPCESGRCSGTAECSCVNEAKKCANDENTKQGKIKTCSDGQWISETICLASDKSLSSCSSGESCGECLNGATKCETKKFKGYEYTCQSGLWVKTKDCSISCNIALTECAI